MKITIARANLRLRFQFVSPLLVGLMSLVLPALARAQVASVQVNSNSDTVYRNSVTIPFTTPQAAGNLNVIVVGASATIASVADSNGNVYALAAGTASTPVSAPPASQEGVTQAIYYAKNIKAGANTVTVTFNQNTPVQSVRIVEYSGLDLTNPVDTSMAGSGSSGPADSGAATTNSANDLIFGAGTITTRFTDHGPGFVTELLNGFGDIVEDEVVTSAGSYHATATLTSGSWVMQMVAFRAAGQTPPTFLAPAIASLSTASSPEAGGIALTITGTNFEPGATVLFSNAAGKTAAGVNCAVTLLVSPNATITCLTPSFPVGLAGITVTNVDAQTSPSFAFSFTTSTPFGTATSTSITPNTGPTNGGTAVTIAGSDFAAGATVTVGGVPADNVSVGNINTIQANLPAGSSGPGAVVVTNPSGTAGTLGGGYTYAAGAGINFVQVHSVQPTSPATTATITYSIAQTAGNLNVVIIGWRDTTTMVQSVMDSAGNTYTLAFNATPGTGLSQAIYYAKNIKAAASNTVTVTFSAAAPSPDVRVLEYSGIDPMTPLDAAAAGGSAGTGTALDSGPITTSNAGDLIIGATLGGIVTAAGRGFTTVTITPAGDNVEHLIGPAVGVIDATATQSASTAWVMQAVAFRQAPIPDFVVSVLPPSTASVTPGGSASYTISVSELDGFNSAVALTCSVGLPSGASCSFAPPSVTPGSAPVTSILTISTSAATPAGISNVTVTGTSGSLTHSTLVSLTVNAPADFTIAASPLSPATVSAGGSATSTITITPANGFTGTVSLACSISGGGTPAPTCSFNPNSVANGSGTSMLTVNTTAAHASLTSSSRGIFYAIFLPIGGIALLGAGFTSRRKKLLGLLLACLMLSGLIFLAACGGSSSSSGGGGSGHPGTPAGTYTVMVSATSGSLTHPATVTLSVQ